MIHYFLDSYDESRKSFIDSLETIRKGWKNAEIGSLPIPGTEGLSIDWIEAPAVKEPKRKIIFTAAEHGIEGYVGTAIFRLFLKEFIPKLDSKTTGLALVHAINPWGMKYRRRTNQFNVDLNRNFLYPGEEYDPDYNQGYKKIDCFVNPKSVIRNSDADKLSYPFRLGRAIINGGYDNFRFAVLLGQYAFPRGIYFGGISPQVETSQMIRLYQKWAGEGDLILHLDMHTGYGPRYQMSIVNSSLEKTESVHFAKEIHYPLVSKANPDEFYSMRGDMIDYFYKMMAGEFPGKPFYGTSFEFGTFGDSLTASLRAVRAMILENQAYHFGVMREKDRLQIVDDFYELFCPSESNWRVKAESDARQAIQGILNYFGYL